MECPICSCKTHKKINMVVDYELGELEEFEMECTDCGNVYAKYSFGELHKSEPMVVGVYA